MVEKKLSPEYQMVLEINYLFMLPPMHFQNH